MAKRQQAPFEGAAPEPKKPFALWRDGAWIQRVCDLALRHPEWGCDRLAYYLHLQGQSISGPTVQRILNAAKLGKVADRRMRAETPPVKISASNLG